MSDMQAVIVIPMRYGSTRLEAKALLDETGKTLIQHVVENARKSKLAGKIIVATDDERIAESVRYFGGEAVLTSKDHQSGTDRIAEAVKGISDADIIINLQGDEPTVSMESVDHMIQTMGEDSEIQMATLGFKLQSDADKTQEILGDPNTVKVVTDANHNALYFSRAPVPYLRNKEDEGCLKTQAAKHIGVYGFRKSFLMEFSGWEQSPLEKIEKLEQLRAVERGIKIKVIWTKVNPIGIDTLEDYKEFVEEQSKQKIE